MKEEAQWTKRPTRYLGLETLDLARARARSLAGLLAVPSLVVALDDVSVPATLVFAEAALPLDQTLHLALEASSELNRLNVTLALHTLALADAGLEQNTPGMPQSVIQANEDVSGLLLKESRLLEKHLPDMSRKILAANERKQPKLSLDLNDEIGQPLLGMHVRLLALKKGAAASQSGLAREISITQRLVEQSMQTINRFAHEFGIQHAI